MNLASNFVLLIPTYNPPEGWEVNLFERYKMFRDSVKNDFIVVLINDGSKVDIDLGVKFLKEKMGESFHYLTYENNLGKGCALKYGASSILAKNYIFTDIDLPYSIESMQNVWNTMLQTEGIVTGHRALDYYTDLSPLRTFLSKGLKVLNKIILNLPVNDTQCGLKAFDKDVRDLLIQCKTDRFLIDLELLLATNKAGYQITPVKVELRKDITFSTFNSSVLLKEIHNFIKLVWKYRL